MDIQERLTAFAMLGAGWVMWFLVGLSVIGLAVILERAWALMSSRDDMPKLREDLAKHLEQDDVEGAIKRLQASPSFEAGIVREGLAAVAQGPQVVEQRLDAARGIAQSRMQRNLAFLGTVGNNAPFVGLLGTVIGVIRAFHTLEQSAGQVSNGLMAEVGEALVATAIGLFVALPAVAAFNLFMRTVKVRLSWADALGHDVRAHAELHGQRAPSGAKES